MKRYFISLALGVLLTVGMTSCDTETDEKPGGTKIEKMCGYWDVQVDAVDENDEVVYEDFFDLGTVPFFTYNTADDSSTQMWVDDLNNFWEYKFLANIDYAAGTFAATDVVYSEAQYEEDEPGTATIWSGKITENGGLNLHDKPCDAIEFNISFSDDPYPEAYGYDHYRVTGLRHTGFTE